jgi:hypothetical protein
MKTKSKFYSDRAREHQVYNLVTKAKGKSKYDPLRAGLRVPCGFFERSLPSLLWLCLAGAL